MRIWYFLYFCRGEKRLKTTELPVLTFIITATMQLHTHSWLYPRYTHNVVFSTCVSKASMHSMKIGLCGQRSLGTQED